MLRCMGPCDMAFKKKLGFAVTSKETGGQI